MKAELFDDKIDYVPAISRLADLASENDRSDLADILCAVSEAVRDGKESSLVRAVRTWIIESRNPTERTSMWQ